MYNSTQHEQTHSQTSQKHYSFILDCSMYNVNIFICCIPDPTYVNCCAWILKLRSICYDLTKRGMLCLVLVSLMDYVNTRHGKRGVNS